LIIGRIIGWIFLAAGFMVLGHDCLQFLNSGEWNSILLGELWYKFDAQGLNFTQAIIQRYVSEYLWDPILLTVLLWPAWLDFLVPGILITVLFRKRRKASTRSFVD
jgi:hypothetical protein